MNNTVFGSHSFVLLCRHLHATWNFHVGVGKDGQDYENQVETLDSRSRDAVWLPALMHLSSQIRFSPSMLNFLMVCLSCRFSLSVKSVADSGFPGGGGVNSKGSQPIIRPHFPEKLQENEENWARGGIRVRNLFM